MPPTVTVLPKGNPYFFFFFQKFLWEYGLFALTEQQSNSSFQSFSFFFFLMTVSSVSVHTLLVVSSVPSHARPSPRVKSFSENFKLEILHKKYLVTNLLFTQLRQHKLYFIGVNGSDSLIHGSGQN